jgi:hypothetical protein
MIGLSILARLRQNEITVLDDFQKYVINFLSDLVVFLVSKLNRNTQ